MKSSLLALALGAALAGVSGSALAAAQAPAAPPGQTTTPAGRLFFEGDTVKHNIMGQQGPFCVLQSRFTRGEAVAWRVRVLTPQGQLADNMVLRALEVELGNGQRIPLNWGPHGNPPTDYFWAESWTIPADFPTGSLGYKVHATLTDGSVVTWVPFTRPNSQLWVMEGAPRMAPATP
jgi:hypothetical protein